MPLSPTVNGVGGRLLRYVDGLNPPLLAFFLRHSPAIVMSITFISVLSSLISARTAYKFGMALVDLYCAITMKNLALTVTPGIEAD